MNERINAGPYLNSSGRGGMRVIPQIQGYTPGYLQRGEYELLDRRDDCILSGLGLWIFKLLGLKVPTNKLKPIRRQDA